MEFKSEQERLEFQAWQEDKEKKASAEKFKRDRDTYRNLVNETVDELMPFLIETSNTLASSKMKVYDTFRQALEMKADLFEKSVGYNSHTFTNKDFTKRIIIGNYQQDNYDLTVEDGIDLIKSCITELATDDKSRALVDTILRLLSKDAKGNLKPSRIMVLTKTAEQIGDERLLRGVALIREAYSSVRSKTFVRAEIKDAKTNKWKNVPLGMTES
ncbi:MAG: DUF3164 family protein [Prevotellaceae bacterium]|jgi:hypothetical protein|nr:DUF3164 family protein [Prevotellaceae bacterium]